MNRIYKIIFNRSKGQYQVVSELAKNGGKGSAKSLLRTIVGYRGGVFTRTVLTALLMFGSAYSVQAASVHDGDLLNGGTNITVTKDDGTNTITISADGVATTTELNTVKAVVQKNQDDIAGNTTKISGNTDNITANSTAIANNKAGISQNSNEIQQNKTDIAVNKKAIATNSGKIDNNTADITELKNVNSALGLDKTKPGMKYFRANSTGEDAEAAGKDAVAIGVSAKANGTGSVALGDDARSASSAGNSISIGRKAVSGSFNGMTADGDSSTVVIGGGKSSISIGDAANARGNSSIALGDGATVYNDGTNAQLNSSSVAIGTEASTVASNHAIAMGNNAGVTKNSHSAVAVGDSAKAGAEGALAFGKSAAASGVDSMAAGTEAAATGADALAMGKSAQASGTDAVAIGNGAAAGSSASVVLGKDASANAVRSVVLGPDAGVGMVGDVLGAKGSHVVIGDGAGNNIDGQQNIAIGYKAGNDVKSDHNVAIGSEAGTNIGSGGNTSEGKNVSIGYHANKNDSAVSRIQSTALGSETNASDDAVAVGYQAQANGNGSTAVGFNAQAADAASVALGQGAQASGGNVAIGNDSVANAAMISGNGYLTGQTAPKTAVSVGSASALRRITNVADGALDQDAVTVAQLKKSIDATVAQVNANVSSATASGVYYDTVTSGDGDSITLRNTDNKGTKIHNVAAGTLGTDAANVAQVNELVDTAKTHYYSVKSTNLNNYNNDLATGEDSMAAGVSAKALGDRSAALGNNTEAQSLGSITVGAGYENPDNPGSLKQTLAISGYQYNTAIGAGAQAAGNHSMAIGTLATSSIKNGGSSVDKAVAIGYSAGVSDDKAIAIGSDAKSNSKSASAMGDTAQALAENALAVGTNAQAEGVSSGAVGTKNRVTGANTYVLGSQNSTAATGTAADVSASNSGIFGNENRMEGDSNRIVGNQNVLKMESLSSNSANSKTFENIFVTGNRNMVTGDPDTSTAGDAGNVSDIVITGSKNTIRAKNQKNKDLTDIQIFGSQNTLDATTQNTDLSNTQIVGSHVTASLGNSVYLGSNSAYVVSGATTKGKEAYSSNGTYQYAGGTPAGIVTVGSVGKERRIQNVAAGLVSVKSTDAVNGSQLYSMTRPLRFAGDNSTIGTASEADVNVLHRGSDQVMSLLGGADSSNLSDNNIGVVADSANNTMTVKLAKDITGLNSVTSKTVNAETVKAGDTTINNQGVAITGGPSVTKEGINANGTKITNVAAGTVDTDAVNVSQLTKQFADLTEKGFGLKDQDGNIVHKSLGEDIEVIGDGKNISTKVENGTMKVVLNDDLNVNSVTTTDADGNQTVTQGSGMTITNKDGNKTAIDASGITITPKNPAAGTSAVSLTEKGLDNGGNQIHNVAAGTAGTDAVNVSQLKDEIAKNATKLVDGKNTTVTGTGTAENPYMVNVKDNLNLGKKGEDGIDGSIGVAGKDGSAVIINGKDGSIGMNGKDGKDGLTMKSAKGQDGVDGINGADGMTRIVYEDDAHGSHQVATLDDGLKFAGNTGSVAKKLNSTMTIKGNGTKADTEYDASNIKTVVDADGNLVIGLDKNLKADTVTVGGQGKDGADGINGAMGVKGADGKDGVTISSIGKDGTNGTDGHIGINGKDGASADIHVVKGANGVDGTDGYNGTGGIDRIVYEDHNGNTQTVATMNDGMKYGGDVGNVINKKLNGQVNVVGGITDSSRLTTEDNIGVVSDGSDNLKVRLSKDLKGLDTVTTKTVTADTGNITTVNASTVNVGDTTVTTGGMTIQNGSAGQDVTLNKDGLNNGGNKITHVAPGDISSTSTDAVNGSQLYRAETRISKLGDQVNRVGAGAAALAGLHPLDFDPDDKWDFAVGYGNYKDAHAVAVGAFYRPNEDTMFSVGGSFSGGENMVNAGVSWKFGQKNHASRSRVSMARDMLAMKAQIEVLTKKLAAYESGQNVKAVPNPANSMMFPDVPENHWAYQYVKTLAERGYLQGYPDGEFKGDRAMTRYEYAAIIYRALQNGAPSDGDMARSVDEFGPELVKVQNIDRFRVDRISGKDNDRHKVERVRINDKDNEAQNDYRDVYGSHIQKSQETVR